MTNINNASLFIDKITKASEWQKLRFATCCLTSAKSAPDTTRTMARRIIMIISGSRLYRYGDGENQIERKVVPGDILVAEPCAGIWSQEEGEYELLSIVCSMKFIRFVYKVRHHEEPLRTGPDVVYHSTGSNSNCLDSLLKALFSVVTARHHETACLICSAVWNECRIALEVAKQEAVDTPNYLLERILTYIEGHLSEQMTCASIGKKFQVNGNYIAQLFHRFMHCGFSRYLMEQRLELAKRLLVSSSMNIAEIAAYCGYRNANYFIRVFRQQYECTPFRYRLIHYSKNIESKDRSAIRIQPGQQFAD